MARKPQVTRTITTTVVSLFCVNTEDRTAFEQSLTLPRTYKDEQKLMKAVADSGKTVEEVLEFLKKK